MKKETLTGSLMVECDAITATVVQNFENKKRKGFYLEISNRYTDEVLETEVQPSMRKVYERINTINRAYKKS